MTHMEWLYARARWRLERKKLYDLMGETDMEWFRNYSAKVSPREA